jgi:hypothetical protein
MLPRAPSHSLYASGLTARDVPDVLEVAAARHCLHLKYAQALLLAEAND